MFSLINAVRAGIEVFIPDLDVLLAKYREVEEQTRTAFPVVSKIRKFNRIHFYNTVREAFGNLTNNQVKSISAKLDFMESDTHITDIKDFAYMLATVKHETADTYLPIEEYGKGRGRIYGIADVVTGKVYFGRGDVQLTWKKNYIKIDKELGSDIVNHPEKALDPPLAYLIMSYGMRAGLFTGKKLDDYINEQDTNYTQARKLKEQSYVFS